MRKYATQRAERFGMDTSDFETADAVRDEISAMGISLMDTPNGVVWEKL